MSDIPFPPEDNSIYTEETVAKNRPSWDSVYLDFALHLAERGTCRRLQVGCVITSWDSNRVLAIGYNGNYKGGPNVCDSEEVGNCGCVHSETNALVKLDYNDHAKKRAYITHSPCLMCAKLIINAGISEVVFISMYRDDAGVQLLEKMFPVLPAARRRKRHRAYRLDFVQYKLDLSVRHGMRSSCAQFAGQSHHSSIRTQCPLWSILPYRPTAATPRSPHIWRKRPRNRRVLCRAASVRCGG